MPACWKTPVKVARAEAEPINSRPLTRIPPGVEPEVTVNRLRGDVAVNWDRVRDNMLSDLRMGSRSRGLREIDFLFRFLEVFFFAPWTGLVKAAVKVWTRESRGVCLFIVWDPS